MATQNHSDSCALRLGQAQPFSTSPARKDQSWHCRVTVPGTEGDVCCLALLPSPCLDAVNIAHRLEPFLRSHTAQMEKRKVNLLCLQKESLPLYISREPLGLVLLCSRCHSYIKPLRGWKYGSDGGEEHYCFQSI